MTLEGWSHSWASSCASGTVPRILPNGKKNKTLEMVTGNQARAAYTSVMMLAGRMLQDVLFWDKAQQVTPQVAVDPCSQVSAGLRNVHTAGFQKVTSRSTLETCQGTVCFVHTVLHRFIHTVI